MKTVCSALFRLHHNVDAASRSAVLGRGGRTKSDGEAKPFCCCFIRILSPPVVPPASLLHAVSRYPALIGSALDMKGLQIRSDGFMPHIMHKQSSQEGKMEPGNKAAGAISLTSTKRKVNADVLVLWCGVFTVPFSRTLNIKNCLESGLLPSKNVIKSSAESPSLLP